MRVLLFFVFFTASAFASDWTRYENERFGVSIDIPPGFVNDVDPPENGDGLTFHSVDGRAELLVWGSHVTEASFADEATTRMNSEINDGWAVAYVKHGNDDSWLVYSGSREGRLVYAKTMGACKGTLSVNFRIEYPVDQRAAYDAVVTRLASSLKDGPAIDCS